MRLTIPLDISIFMYAREFYTLNIHLKHHNGSQIQLEQKLTFSLGLDISDRDHLVSSVQLHPDADFQRSEVNFSRRVPDWLWAALTAMLGIGVGISAWRSFVAALMRIMTIASALVFAGFGLAFKVFDVLSENTKTTMLDACGDAVLAAYWVGMGIYARTIAARLFSNPLFVECIRMHSKTIFKMNTAAIIVFLSMTGVSTSLYTNRNVVEWNSSSEGSNANSTEEGSCANAGIHVAVCEVYFSARVLYSAFNLFWNLLVATILLSVCRTHTISIRRFMKELLYDNQIYEEFIMLQGLAVQAFPSEANLNQKERPQTMAAILGEIVARFSKEKGWDNSMNDLEEDGDRPPSNAVILNTMRSIRASAYDNRALEGQTQPTGSAMGATLIPPLGGPRRPTLSEITETSDSHQDGDVPVTRRGNNVLSENRPTNQEAPENDNAHLRLLNSILSSLGPDEALYRHALEQGEAPIMSPEDLLFKYFQFVFVLPTPERVDPLDHMREDPPELKVFSFKITYNAILTVVAGVAVSFATSVLLEQIMGKNQTK
ncbi:hypothetical protein ElyMa_005328000 [Elysia marginata]|uniref:G-protein coupled receptors family 1 profile domain-containing protein n=1 Tax=Elysia marginata TaxID=1093978 RepID=A0AAV4K211_9GAST|nr:hypothetical protein ElyMa_005328000 [Elysia marginata]